MMSLLKYKKILIIEDDEINSYLIEIYLEREGYDSVVTKSGNEALKILETEMFDIIILDLHMKYMNGYEFLRIIRKIKIEIPVIITSAYTRQFELEPPVTAYLLKPVKKDVLVNEIKKIFKKQIKETEIVEDNPKEDYSL